MIKLILHERNINFPMVNIFSLGYYARRELFFLLSKTLLISLNSLRTELWIQKSLLKTMI